MNLSDQVAGLLSKAFIPANTSTRAMALQVLDSFAARASSCWRSSGVRFSAIRLADETPLGDLEREALEGDVVGMMYI